MDYEVGMQVRVVAVPHDYCSPRIGDVLTVTKVWDHGVMATTHMGLAKHCSYSGGQDKYHLFFAFDTIEPVVEDGGKTLKELDVKPGDIVGFKSAGDESWVVQEGYSVFSNQLFANIELGKHYWEHEKGFKIISRAGETKVQKEEDDTEVFYGLDGVGFFDVEPPYYDKCLVLNHTTGTFTLERI